MKRTQIILLAALLCLLATMVHAGVTTLPPGRITNYTFVSGTPSNPSIYNAATGGTICAGKFPEAAPNQSNTHTLILNGAHDITINGVQFDGDGIKLDNTSNITFDNGWSVTNALRKSGNHQAFSGGGNTNLRLKNGRISNCTWAAIMYDGNNGECTDVIIDRVGLGWMWSTDNWPITRLQVKRARASGLIYLGNSPRTIPVRDYAYYDAERYDDDTKNGGESVGASIPNANGRLAFINGYISGECFILNSDGSPKMVNGQQERRATRPGWMGVRQGLEFGGPNPVIDGLFVDRVHDPGAGVTTPPSHGAKVTNSLWIPVKDSAGNVITEPFDFENQGAAADAAAMGSNAVKINGTWRFLPEGRLPQIGGWTLAGVVPPGQTPPPTTQPPTTIPNPIPAKYEGVIQFDSATGNVTGKMTVKP